MQYGGCQGSWHRGRDGCSRGDLRVIVDELDQERVAGAGGDPLAAEEAGEFDDVPDATESGDGCDKDGVGPKEERLAGRVRVLRRRSRRIPSVLA